MPLLYVRSLSRRQRSEHANQHLGLVLTFVAGAINAGGFLATHQYTSHMTGIVSSMADHLALGAFDLFLSGLGGLLSFLIGTILSTIMVNYAKRRRMNSTYALPLLLEATLLLVFGMLGAQLSQIDGLFVPVTVMLLCFIMGLQNALITKITHAEIRTTHITGIVTDLGIELGRLLYWNRTDPSQRGPVVANRPRIKLLGSLLFSFSSGGFIGALGFKHLGYFSTVPLALLLVGLAMLPAIDDCIVFFRHLKRSESHFQG